MPWSRSTSATAGDDRVGVPRLSCISTPSAVRSGTMSAKSLVCLTCPAITAWVTPASFRRLMHLPSWPSDTQCRSAAGGRAGSVGQVGKRLFLDGDDRDLWPAARAASRTRNGNRPLPAIKPEPHACYSSASTSSAPARRAPQDDAALRRADEVDQVLHFGAGQRAVALDLAAARSSCSASTAAGSGTCV